MSNEIEECMRRILSHKGVAGVIVINHEGSIFDITKYASYNLSSALAIPIKSTLDNALTVQYAGLVRQLVDRSRMVVKDLDANNDLTFIRLRTSKHEVIVCPERDYVMIVIQNPLE